MKPLRSIVRRVQHLENDAVDKAAVRLLLLDDDALTGGGGKKYAAEFVERVLVDIGPEILQAAKIGRTFFREIAK